MDCKISMPSAQTPHWVQRNAQMFIKVRQNDDDDDDDGDDDDVAVSAGGKHLFLNWQTFLKLRNVCYMIYHLSDL